MSHPLAETFGALDTDDHRTLVAGPPGGEGWETLAGAIADEQRFDHWFDTVRRSVLNHRDDVTGSYLASFLGELLATPLARSLRTQHRAWQYDPVTTWVRLTDDGWFDGLAVDAALLVLPSEPVAAIAERSDVAVVDTLDTLTDVAFGALVEALRPAFAMTRARAPYGLRGMWSSIADSIVSDATWAAHVAGDDVVGARDSALELVDVFERVAPTAITRPTLDLVELDGRSAHLTTRGTCCLYYRSLTDPAPGDYCTSCPLGTEADCSLRRVNWLRRQIADTTTTG